MSWFFSQALVAEYSAATSLGGEPSVQSSGNPTQLAYLPPDRMTAFSRPSRFGMTFGPLTEPLGAELLTWFLAASRARTSAWQAKAQESTENAPECGPTWRGSLARFDPDSRSWRTAQRSLLGDSEECSVTWPRSGMTVGGQCWELPTLAPPTSGTGSGSLLTPLALDSTLSQSLRDGYQREHSFGSLSEQLISLFGLRTTAHLGEKMMGWPLGWTDLKPLATDKSHCAQQQPGDC